MRDLSLPDGDLNIVEAQHLTEEEELAYLLYFRICFMSRDKEILKIKLLKSIKMREIILKKSGTIFHETFPFYFLDSELVIALYHSLIMIFDHFYFYLIYFRINYDFEVRFPQIKTNALMEKWSNVERIILCMLPVQGREICLNYFNEEIGYFLGFLKLVSLKTKFEERVDQFLIYTDVSEFNNDEIYNFTKL